LLQNKDILRIYVFYQKCRYAKKTQISLDPKKYRYVGDITGFGTTKKSELSSSYPKKRQSHF
jgi:hypothetical protein